MYKSKQEYFSFLKKLHRFLKDEDLRKEYFKNFGTYEKNNGKIVFKEFSEEIIND